MTVYFVLKVLSNEASQMENMEYHEYLLKRLR